jgi:hypothetical protein
MRDVEVGLVKVADVTPLDDEARALSHEELMEVTRKHLRENGAPAR